MKNIFFIAMFIIVFGLAFPVLSFAQGMMGNNMMSDNGAITPSDDGHTAREEAAGKGVWEKLQAKELACEDLSDDDFGALGEYFMGQMMGDSHEAMNKMMMQMMGQAGEEQMHVALGKRMSSCEPNALMPQTMMGSGMMPMMMRMMMGGGMMGGGGNTMMGNLAAYPTSWFGWGFGWIFMILWWVLIITGIVVLVRWLAGQSRGLHSREKSPLEILKERYAKGEIDKKEFEEKKRDLS